MEMSKNMHKGLLEYQRKVAAGLIEAASNTNPQQRFERKVTRKSAIDAKCWDCACEQRTEIALCTCTDCSLYSFRPYKQKEQHVPDPLA